MAGLTLQQYINRAWKRASRKPNITFLTNDQITEIINEGRREAWNRMLDMDDNHGIVTDFPLSTESGTVNYDLPANYRKLADIRRADGIGQPLKMDKRIADQSDTTNFFAESGVYALAGRNTLTDRAIVRVLPSTIGNLSITYLKDLTEFEYVESVVDDDGQTTTYGITSKDPDLPRYAQDAVNMYVVREMFAIEGNSGWYEKWDKRYDKALIQLERDCQEHLQIQDLHNTVQQYGGDFANG